ncbi:hypothetical protein OCU04_005972 [Sclerotinia nivalis]|uniref:Uncharacterized protein n=1 Tax=Sclerotinia nivalis TaxID=352851 RepID=A0A9X0AMX5_9HELO|nr:hypothetical protein OCU04_005972 [Sclerotinia nivalis]
MLRDRQEDIPWMSNYSTHSVINDQLRDKQLLVSFFVTIRVKGGYRVSLGKPGKYVQRTLFNRVEEHVYVMWQRGLSKMATEEVASVLWAEQRITTVANT